jgi:hypothetical protein
MATLWANNGKIVVNADGHIVACGNCPCVCYPQLLEAIRERQLATARTVWAVDAEKTLEECIAEVDALAPLFLAAAYTGGESAPAVNSGTYADAAADYCELYDLTILLMSSLTLSCGASGISLYEGGRGWITAGNGTSSALAKTAAETAWPVSYNRAEGDVPDAVLQAETIQTYAVDATPPYLAAIIAMEASILVTPPTDTISRAARVFALISQSLTYDTYGLHSFEANHWCLYAETASGTWADWSTGYWPTDNPPDILTPWCADPTEGVPSDIHGWKVFKEDIRVIIDWDFAHHPAPP